MLFAASAQASASPTVVTDQADYPPGSTVTLTGAGWQSHEPIHIDVTDGAGALPSGGTLSDPSNSLVTPPWSYSTDVVADETGAFTAQFDLPTSFVAQYSVTATGSSSGTATTTFTDSAANPDQCKN